MSFQKLKLNEIQDEILDECFNEEAQELNLDEEFDEDIQPSNDVSEETFQHIKDESEFIKNELLLQQIADGVNVSSAREKLVRQNYGLVYSEARRCTCNIPFHDKLQYGFEGLLRAISKYNVKQSTQFTTYATTSIRNTMYRHGNNDVRMVALPEWLSVRNSDIQNYVNSYMDQHHVMPSDEQIANATGIDIRSVKHVLSHSTAMISLDMPTHGIESDVTLQDVLTSDGDDYSLDENCFSIEFREGIEKALEYLNTAERKLFAMMNGFDGYKPHTLDEVLQSFYRDERGKLITTKPSLSRRYTSVLDKMAKILTSKGIILRDK